MVAGADLGEGLVHAYRLDRRALARGLLAAAVVLLMVAGGSGWFRWFDTALAGSLFGVLFFVFATVYRCSVWLQRPPTAKLRQRGWEALRQREIRSANLRSLPGLVYTWWRFLSSPRAT